MNVQEQLTLTTDEHNKIRRIKEDTSTQLRILEEQFDKDRMSWENELTELRNQKAKISENSDQNVIMLDNQLEEITKNRDLIRDELRKAKEEIMKEREELEVAKKKMISKIDRVAKSKEELEQIKEETDKAHSKSLPKLSQSIIVHASDLHPWVDILEEARSYEHKEIKLPSADINNLEFIAQMQELTHFVAIENINFEKLLIDRSKEKQEILSVAMGKLKKREKNKTRKRN